MFDTTEKLWNKLEKTGHILNFKRDKDPKRYNVYLENGMIKIECNHGTTQMCTIDTFLHLFAQGFPCDLDYTFE